MAVLRTDYFELISASYRADIFYRRVTKTDIQYYLQPTETKMRRMSSNAFNLYVQGISTEWYAIAIYESSLSVLIITWCSG